MKTLHENTGRKNTSYLQLQIDQDRRDVLERAATLTGRSITKFVLDSAEQAAIKTIEEQQVLRLTQRDSDFLVATMMANPSEPGKRLREAAFRYKDAVVDV